MPASAQILFKVAGKILGLCSQGGKVSIAQPAMDLGRRRQSTPDSAAAPHRVPYPLHPDEVAISPHLHATLPNAFLYRCYFEGPSNPLTINSNISQGTFSKKQPQGNGIAAVKSRLAGSGLLSDNRLSGALINPGSGRRDGLPASPSCCSEGSSAPHLKFQLVGPTQDFGWGLGSEDLVPVIVLERTQADCHPTQAPPGALGLRGTSVFPGQPLALGCESGLILSLLSKGRANPALGNVCDGETYLACLQSSLFIKHECLQKLLSQPHEFCKKQNTGKRKKKNPKNPQQQSTPYSPDFLYETMRDLSLSLPLCFFLCLCLSLPPPARRGYVGRAGESEMFLLVSCAQ